MKNIRAKSRYIKQRTTLQDRRRNAFTKCVIAWKETAKQNKTALWIIYANTHTTTNKRGKIVKLTGWNWFLHFNLYRTYNNLEAVLEPPE